MEFMRYLSKGCEPGVDVFYIKQRLFDMGLLDVEISHDNKDIFDEDLERAVVAFSCRNGLSGRSLTYDDMPVIEPDKWIDEFIWDRIEREYTKQKFSFQPRFNNEGVIPDDENIGAPFTFPTNISAEKAEKISKALGGISSVRRKIVMEALKYAYDRTMSGYHPLSLYIPGYTLYSKQDQETPNVVTSEMICMIEMRYNLIPDKIKLMRDTIALYPNTVGADDCGGIVGLCHFAKVCKPYTDVTANALATDRYSKEITKEELLPGDWLHKENHIGLYVGDQYAVEWIGGRYGCQITDISGKRVVYNFSLNQLVELKPWERYRRPLWY